MAAPTGAVTLYGTRRASSTMLCSMRLPPTGSAAKPLAMLRWVRPDQIVMLKLIRESRNKNLDFFATFLRLGIVPSFPTRDGGAKAQVNRFHGGLFSLCGDRSEPLIAKKLQRCRNFCFHDGRIASTGRYRNGVGCVGLFSLGFISSLFRKCPDSVTMRD